MKTTVTVTQEEYDRLLNFCYGDKDVFEAELKKRMEMYGRCKDRDEVCYDRYTRAKLMLEKLEFEKYNYKSIETEGSGADKYISYMEWQDGTPLTESELDSVLDDYQLHQDLMASKFLD